MVFNHFYSYIVRLPDSVPRGTTFLVNANELEGKEHIAPNDFSQNSSKKHSVGWTFIVSIIVYHDKFSFIVITINSS